MNTSITELERAWASIHKEIHDDESEDEANLIMPDLSRLN